MDIKNISIYANQTVEQNEQTGKTFQGIINQEQKKVAEVSDLVSVGTNMSAGDSGAYTAVGAGGDNADMAEARLMEKENLAVLTGEDYANLEEEGSVMEAGEESLERAVEKIKEQKAWDAKQMQESLALREEFQEDLELIQAKGFLSQKSEAQLRQILEEVGIPATAENITQIVTALGMSQDALALTDQSMAYVIGQNLLPTIENLYQGKYSIYSGQNIQGSQQNFADYEAQIRDILESCNKLDEEGMQAAKWLFEQELPINGETLGRLETLQEIGSQMTMSDVLEQIIIAMKAGYQPKNANLDASRYNEAKEAVAEFQAISDNAIAKAASTTVESNLEILWQNEQELEMSAEETVSIPLFYTDDMDEDLVAQVTLKRQVEEIRQKMTVQAAVRMGQKGIHIDTARLDDIIEELRNIENSYYSKRLGGDAVVMSEQEMDLFQETLSKTKDIANAHAAILGTGVRRHTLLTVNELHAAIGSATANRKEWQGVYETVATEVRKDLGDSIQKAFQNIPDILKEIGLENTLSNERAVRILAYNRMEITQESIEEVKLFDAKVNQVIENMKPTTVMELIRKGENPLDMPLEQLNEKLEEINRENGVTSQEKFSRYLWQLEKNNQITPEERAGYIGVYRLLNQIEKSDGAVIGAVMETRQELTLGNLLTQARTMKGKGIDSRIDESTGFSEVHSEKLSITEQIHLGFSQNTMEQLSYQQNLISKTIEEITPSKLQEMTEGDLDKLLNLSPEKMYEQIKTAAGDREIQNAYYDEQAKQLREALSDSEAVKEFLAKLQVEETAANIMTAKLIVEEGFSPYKEFYNGRKKVTKEEQNEFDEVVDSFDENMEDEELLNAQCEKSEKIMQDILTKSSEQADINFEDLRRFQQISRGIRLEGVFRSSHSYDIPIRTGDSITSLNLTIIHGAKESGKIQVSMEDESFGNISMDFKVSKDSVKGLVLCDQRQGFEALQEQEAVLKENIADAGYQVKNISYGMDFKSRNELLNEMVQKDTADTNKLYQVAKILVRSVTAVIQKNN